MARTVLTRSEALAFANQWIKDNPERVKQIHDTSRTPKADIQKIIEESIGELYWADTEELKGGFSADPADDVRFKLKADGQGGVTAVGANTRARGKAKSSQIRYAKVKPKTPAEARYLREARRINRELNDTLIHQATYGDRESIVEHNRMGVNDYLSHSDPDFKLWKDNLERKRNSMGWTEDDVVIDLNDRGGTRMMPADTYNAFDPSRSPGLDIDEIDDVDAMFKQFDRKFMQPLQAASDGIRLNKRFLRQALRVAAPSIGGASLVLGGLDAYGREMDAQEDPSLINKVQAGISKVETAADAAGAIPSPMSIIAEPVAFVAGLTNLAIDGIRLVMQPTENKEEIIQGIGANSRL